MELELQNGRSEASILQACEILDTPPEAEYDDAVQVAGAVCDAPIAVLALADGDRFWFKAKQGLDATEIPRDDSMCSIVVEAECAIVVPDLDLETRISACALLRVHGVRFYCGVPVRCSGQLVGVLCALDSEPKTLTPMALDALHALARQVGVLLETRLANSKFRDSEAQLAAALSNSQISNEYANIAAKRFETLFSRIPVPCFTCDADLTIYEWNRSAARLWGMDGFEVVMRSVPDVLQWPMEEGFVPDGLGKALEGDSVEGYEWETVVADGSRKWLRMSAFPIHSSTGDVVGVICACTDITEVKHSEEIVNEVFGSLRERPLKKLKAS